MKNTILFVLITLSLLLIGCTAAPSGTTGTTGPADTPPAQKTEPAQSQLDSNLDCTTDSDCICGGVDPYSERCYLGNKDYYEKYVNKSRDCPDFCTGIAGNLAVKCVAGKCRQMMSCIQDEDCGGGEECVNNKCVTSLKNTANDGSECRADSDCKTAGCSGELCMEKSKAGDIATICVYRPEYECLKMVNCGCMAGKCAWRTTEEYDSCVKDAQEKGITELLPE